MIVPSSNFGSRRRAGKIIVLMLLSLSVIVGIVAITMDGGRVLEERRHDQLAADAAALAAARDLYANYHSNHGNDPTGTARAAALNVTNVNSVPAGAVTVNIPPQSGTFAGQAGYVEVVINSTLEATFGKALTHESLNVTGRAVARGQPMKIGLILLRPNGSDAFLNESLAFTVINSPIIVNSADSSAFDQAVFGVTVASEYDIVGGLTNTGGAVMLGTVHTGVKPTPDPLAFLPIPDSTGLAIQSTGPLTINSLLPATLQPGIYQGGIRIIGLSSVVMQPGLYIMQGGGLQVGDAATVVGTEVMIYNTTGSKYPAGSIAVTSVGKVALVAPESGIYQGINVFQDRSLASPITMTGVGLAAITGVIYAVSAPVSLTGGALVGLDVLGGGWVVDSMTVRGVGAINIDLGLNPPRVPDVRLVE